MIRIKNDLLEASFLPKGAELKSLRTIHTSKEWMWEADPAFWGKTSPILFPIVGGLKNNTYRFEGKDYELPRHGFARDMDFEVRQQEESRVVFGLKSTTETHSLYPFDFDLEVAYTLQENSLTTEYRVKNTSDQKLLWFSLGAHPAFAIEVNQEKAFNDYQLLFDNDSTLHVHPLENNLLQRKTNDLPLPHQALPLAYSLFENDALVMTDMQSSQLTLANSKDSQKLTFSFSNFPYFGIWSAKNANFVCLEPWAGIADFEDHNGQLTDKFGILSLPPATVWNSFWKVEVQY